MSGNKSAAAPFAGVARKMLRAALITVVLGSALYAQTPAAAPSSPPEKVWPDAGLRGINVPAFNPDISSPGFLDDEDFKSFKTWNINVLRLWLEPDRAKSGEKLPPLPANSDLLAPYKKNLEGLRATLGLAEKYHIFIIPVMGEIVGRDTGAATPEVSSPATDPGLIAIWEYIAKNFGANPWLIGYDLLNEPHTKSEREYWYPRMLPQLIELIRAIDRNTYLVIETAMWALPDQAFPETLVPVKDPKVVYSFHFYYPNGYTTQGVNEYMGPKYEGKTYPGMLRLWPTTEPTLWNKAALLSVMKNVIVFQKKYGVKIFVGEFSVARWAPGAARWVADAADIFERQHWSWTFHGYGGWNGWNPTFPADAIQTCSINNGGAETDRMKVLLKVWAKNEKY